MPLLNNPYYIIIHHSATFDQKLFSNFQALRTYHMSYAIDGYVVDEDEFYERMSLHDGSYFKKPWKDIGYHYVIEYVDNLLVIREGRVEDEYGAHEFRKMPSRFGKLVSINYQSIGICVIGNYDKDKPTNEVLDKLISLIIPLLRKYSIPLENVLGHREIDGVDKTCPGLNFDMNDLRRKISILK